MFSGPCPMVLRELTCEPFKMVLICLPNLNLLEDALSVENKFMQKKHLFCPTLSANKQVAFVDDKKKVDAVKQQHLQISDGFSCQPSGFSAAT